MKAGRLRWVRFLPALTLVALQATLGSMQPAAAAPGDLVADVYTPEAAMAWPLGIAKAVAFDGHYLYYAEYAGPILHRINVPPPGASNATGHTDIPVVGAPDGIMTIAYDAGRDVFWAVSGDGTAIYVLSKTGMATRQFTIDTVNGLPGNCKTSTCSAEVKIAYDRADDTIWYSPDTTHRAYHFQTTGDALGNAVLVASSPYVDVDVAPNDMSAQCPYGSYASGIATGGPYLVFENSACNYYFEYTKAGVKVAAIPHGILTSGGMTCDNVSYTVSVIWMRGGWDGHIYAFEQPQANACVYGG
jgi:hypothetical protein